MRKWLIAIIFFACCAGAQGQVSSSNARRVYSGTAIPTQPCSPGPIYRDVYIRVSTGIWYQCTAAPATWTAIPAGSGTVTSVTGTAPIASSGGATPAISLNDTAVTPGSYTFASITVDQKGRLTAASNGASPSIAPLQLTDANTVEQYNSTTAQTFNLYNTRTDASNYERSFWKWNTNVLEFGIANAGTGAVRSMKVGVGTDTYIWGFNTSGGSHLNLLGTNGTDIIYRFSGANGNFQSQYQHTWGATPNGTQDVGLVRTGTGALKVSNADSGFGSIQTSAYLTATNCADSAGAAACGSAAAGAVVIDAAATTVVVSTTAVTADSQIFIQEDSSLNTRLGITCNTTIARLYTVTARTAATSFTITTSAAPITNPACLNYKIVN